MKKIMLREVTFGVTLPFRFSYGIPVGVPLFQTLLSIYIVIIDVEFHVGSRGKPKLQSSVTCMYVHSIRPKLQSRVHF